MPTSWYLKLRTLVEQLAIYSLDCMHLTRVNVGGGYNEPRKHKSIQKVLLTCAAQMQLNTEGDATKNVGDKYNRLLRYSFAFWSVSADPIHQKSAHQNPIVYACFGVVKLVKTLTELFWFRAQSFDAKHYGVNLFAVETKYSVISLKFKNRNVRHFTAFQHHMSTAPSF